MLSLFSHLMRTSRIPRDQFEGRVAQILTNTDLSLNLQSEVHKLFPRTLGQDFKILELGCGVGKIIPVVTLNPKVASIDPNVNYVGLDSNRACIDYANELILNRDQLILPKASFAHVADLLEGLKKAPKTDLILVHNYLKTLDEYKLRKFLQVSHSKLKEGGKLFFSIPSDVYESKSTKDISHEVASGLERVNRSIENGPFLKGLSNERVLAYFLEEMSSIHMTGNLRTNFVLLDGRISLLSRVAGLPIESIDGEPLKVVEGAAYYSVGPGGVPEVYFNHSSSALQSYAREVGFSRIDVVAKNDEIFFTLTR